MSFGLNFPSNVSTPWTLCPVASIAPVSLVKMWPVCAEITLSWGFKILEITIKLAWVPPLTKWTLESGELDFSLMIFDASAQ